MSSARALVPALAFVVGCTAGPPSDDGGSAILPTSQSRYADVVLSVATASATMNCAADLPDCLAGTPQRGACAGNPAKGAPDSISFDLGPHDRIELGLQCSAILEVGGGTAAVPSDDFKLWATVDPGAQPIVEASADGVDYLTVNPWAQLNGVYVANPGFQLEFIKRSEVRYVRVTEQAGLGAIHLDALEALPVPQ